MRGRHTGSRAAVALVLIVACGTLPACTTPGPAPIRAETPQVSAEPGPATPSDSSSQSASPSQQTSGSIAEPVDLQRLAAQDPRILTANVSRAEPDAINLSSPCSKRLGLTRAEVEAARTVVYFLCDEVGPPDLSPARIVPDGTTVGQLIAAFMAGPNQRERDAGFAAGPYGPGVPVTLAKLDGILVIDFLAKLPPDFTAFPSGRMLLAATLRAPAGVEGISVLDQHVPGCVVADLCP